MRGLLLLAGALGSIAFAGVTQVEVDAALNAKDYAAAEKLARAWAGEAPKDPAPWTKLTLALHQQKRFDEALAAIQEGKSRGAPPVWIAMRTARARLGKGEVDAAMAEVVSVAKLGFTNKQMLETDPELEPLRKHAGYPALLTQVDRNANPCAYRPESAQFDFWVGEWDVSAAGNPVGQSKVEKILNGCVLQENWTSASGSGGKSFNLYDPEQQKWRQTWVDAGGNITDYAGGLDKSGAMVFTAHDAWPANKVHLRMTFTRLNDTQVRQLIETSPDKKKWSVNFDGLYTRKAPQAAAVP